MSKFGILSIIIHVAAAALWALDSKTIKSWRVRLAWRKAIKDVLPGGRHAGRFEEEFFDFFEEYERAHQERAQYIDATRQVDNDILLNLTKKDFEERKRPKGPSRTSAIDFWLLFDEKNKDN